MAKPLRFEPRLLSELEAVFGALAQQGQQRVTDAHGAATPFGTPPDRTLTVNIPSMLLLSLPVGKRPVPQPIVESWAGENHHRKRTRR